jgi:thiol-disulfide isomerase/thioredoxin
VTWSDHAIPPASPDDSGAARGAHHGRLRNGRQRRHVRGCDSTRQRVGNPKYLVSTWHGSELSSTGRRAIGQLGFTGITLAGKPFDAATLAGKPVLLWFWAPWCPTCVAEAPDVLDIQQAYAGRIGIVGVAGLDKERNMQPFVDRTKTGALTHLADPNGEIWRRFEVAQQSTYVLLDNSGTVTFTGVLGGDELRDKIAALVG